MLIGPRRLGLVLGSLLACSHSSTGTSLGNGDGGGGNGSTDGPNFGFTGGNGGSGANGGGANGGGGSNGTGANGGIDPLPPGCAQVTVQGERLPIDLYMMIDTSASMLAKTADGPTKWEAVRTALTSFFNDQASAGIGVGLQFFPRITAGAPRTCTSDGACGTFGPCLGIRTCSGLSYIQPCGTAADCTGGAACVPFGYCNASHEFCQGVGSPCGNGTDTCTGGIVEGYCLGRDSCTVGDYGTPAVAVAPLPGSAGALNAALTTQIPDGYTPTSAALAGALQQARTLAAAANGRKTAVVLATDGLPTSCAPKDIGGVAALASQALAGTPSIPTFVIGVFAPEEQAGAGPNLDQLAASGGTMRARLVNASQNTTQSFLAALDDIRATAVSCEFKVPATTAKGPVDFGNVNVRFTSGGGVETTIPNVPDRARCPAGGNGWYYDIDPTLGAPTKIETCDATCALLRGDPRGRIDILIGCKTVVIK
jgi:Mg-chelatase subunit ChlD